MPYRVIYHEDRWQVRRHPLLPHSTEECQVIRQELDNGQRLYLELTRQAGGPVRIVIARLEVLFNRHGRHVYRTARFLQPDEVELVQGIALPG